MKAQLSRKSWAGPGIILPGLAFFVVLLAWRTPLFRDIMEVFRQPRVVGIYLRTLGIASGVAALATLSGLLLAYFLYEVRLPGGRIIGFTYFWPLILPPYFLAASWLAWLGDLGFLRGLGVRLTGPGGCVFLMSLYLTPIVVVAVGNALSSRTAETEEAALLMGGRGRYIRRVWLPSVISAALGGGFLAFAIALNNYSIPSILGVNTLSTEVYAEFGAFYSPYQALVKSLPFLFLLFGLFMVLKPNLNAAFGQLTPGHGRTVLDERRSMRWVGGILWAVYLSLALIVPLAGLIIQTRTPGNIIQSLSLAREQILFCLWFGALAAALIVIPGVLLAYGHVRDRLKSGMHWLIGLFITPPVLAGVGLIALLNRPGLNLIYRSGALLYFGYAVRFLPLVFFILIPAITGVPKDLEEASLMTGLSRRKTWRRILLPLLSPALLVAWMLAFFLCSGEADCAILLYPPGAETIAMRVLSLLHYGTSQVVSGLVLVQFIVLAVAALAGLGFYGRLSRKRGKRRERPEEN